MYTLKSLVQRGALLGAAGALVVAAIAPTASVLAQATPLNPLTERSLLLSSSAPGFQDTDGSNYSQANPNPAAGPGIPGTYALPGTGPNGKKSGQTFTFRTSTTSDIRAFTFQYCTTAAGYCQAPGNNAGDARTPDPDRLANDGVGGGWENNTSDLNITAAFGQQGGGTEVPTAGNFQIWINDGTNPAAAATGTWTMATTTNENTEFAHNDGAPASRLTGKNNFITLSSATGQSIPAGSRVKIQFMPNDSTFITNPGQGHFFVKINSYSNQAASTIVDGGVTVANVMTDSIHITTKVLETMAFSVGTQNPDTQPGSGPGNDQHATCGRINQLNNNRLNLGNQAAEYSLETDRAWDVFSYWRLSSNSSGGATVYYSGNTLANTVGDEIDAMETKAVSTPGTNQFGLGFVDPGVDTFHPTFFNPAYDDQEPVDPVTNIRGAVQAPNSKYRIPSSFPFLTLDTQSLGSGEFADLVASQNVSLDYRDATGDITGLLGAPGTAQFKFAKASSHTPEPIAQQNETVVSCATAKMRYVANIGADTPAGVYTTKINYLAAPQY